MSLFETASYFSLKRNQVLGYWPLSGISDLSTSRKYVPTPLNVPYFLARTSSQIYELLTATTAQSSFSAPLCSCSGAIKNPACLATDRGTSGTARVGTVLFHVGAGLAPRCCPFPASTAVTVVKRHSRSASPTIRYCLRARKSVVRLTRPAASPPGSAS